MNFSCFRLGQLALLLAGFALLAGCAHRGHLALERSVLSYDESSAKIETQLLLLNVARREMGLPVHFTQTGSIAATFRWEARGSVSANLRDGATLDPLGIDASVSGTENPTFSIFPVTGEEFTRRILTPLQEEVFNAVIFQGESIDMALRLLANGIEVQRFEMLEDGIANAIYEREIFNDPRMPDQYEEFRKIVLHLQWLYNRQELFVRTLTFDVPLATVPEEPELFEKKDAFQRGLRWYEELDGSWSLKFPSGGRVVILNYDPMTLTDKERWQLNESIRKLPPSFVYTEIRPEGPGGNFPLQGSFRLRSMVQILDFIARGIEYAPEFDVEKDPRTGDVYFYSELALNPAKVLEIIRSEKTPHDLNRSVQYAGRYYSVAPTAWDRAAFRVLTWLLQASMGFVQSPGIPITIAK